MKCPNCGTENPEGKKFCGDCGAMIPQPPPPPPVEPAQTTAIQPKQSWIRSNWKGLVSVVVVVLVVLSVVGLIYSQPWSKITVLLAYNGHGQIGVSVYIDGILKASIGLNPGAGYQIAGVWPVDSGSHVVSVDHGYWENRGSTYWPDWVYTGPDGVMDFTYDWQVGPLYTKNAFIQL